MEKNKLESGTLYLVGTPIGNLSDMSERVKKTLSECDFIAAEDTRVTAKLLSFLGIKKQSVSYHEHNKRECGEYIAKRLADGEICALVTDAGMPGISDPGGDMAALCHEKGIKVSVIPGPSAAVCAAAASGLYTGRFTFEGFLSVTKTKRRAHLEALKTERRTMIFYEAPHKLPRTLADMLEILGDRPIALARELTKLNEEIVRTTLARAAEEYKTRKPIGEYVIVAAGAPEEKPAENSALPETCGGCGITPEERVRRYTENGLPRMEAVKKAAGDCGMSKREFYKLLVDGNK